MRPLAEARRRTLFSIAAMLCAVPAALAPIAARSTLDVELQRAQLEGRFAALPSVGASLPPRAVALRDPFVPDASPGPRRAVLPRITAVVTGAAPRALIETGTRVRMVGVGDALAGSRIVGIDADGIRLAAGITIPFAQRQP